MIVTKTPLRISFFSGGSDLYSFYSKEKGAALSATIDKYVYVTVHHTPDVTKFVHNEMEYTSEVALMRHRITRECLRLFEVKKDITVTSITDLPCEGSGLGSSSAYTVGLINALNFYEYSNIQYRHDQLAVVACDIEIDKCQYPIGKQDQFAAAVGGLNLFEFHPNGCVFSPMHNVTKNCLTLLKDNLFLVYTGRSRDNSTIMQDFKSELQLDNALKLDMVRKNRDRAYTGINYLENYGLDAFGRLLHNSWEEKKKITPGASFKEVDSLYSVCHNAGALGGKILGAGGGGYMLIHAPDDKKEVVKKVIEDKGFRIYPFNFSFEGSKVILAEVDGSPVPLSSLFSPHGHVRLKE